MKARTILTAVVAVALLAVPGFLAAQGAFGGPGDRGFGMRGGGPGGPGLKMAHRILDRLGDYLELTDEQRDQIQAILDSEEPAIREMVDQARSAHQAFRESHDPGTFNEEQFRAFAEEQAQLKIEIHVAGARTISQVYNVLTAEQQQKLEELRALVGPRHGRGGGRFGGKGPGS